MYQFNWLERRTGNLMNLDSIFQHTASVNWRKQCWWRWGWGGGLPRLAGHLSAGQWAGLRLSSSIRPTVTHLTMMSLKVNWPLFQCDDNANWVAKHNTEGLLCAAEGEEGGQIKWPYNRGCQARQMLLCAQVCIDISLACQAWALGESYRAGDQMVPHWVPWIKQLNRAAWLLKKDNSATRNVVVGK